MKLRCIEICKEIITYFAQKEWFAKSLRLNTCCVAFQNMMSAIITQISACLCTAFNASFFSLTQARQLSKDKFTQKWEISHSLLTFMLMGTQVKVCSQVKVSGVSQQNSDAAFSYKREVDRVCDRKKHKNKHKMAHYSLSGIIQVSRSFGVPYWFEKIR